MGPLRLIAACLLAVPLVAACVATVDGRPVAGPSSAQSSSSAPPAPNGAYRVGECLAIESGIETVPCDSPHDYEVTVSDALPAGVPDTYPPELRMVAGPVCKAAMAPYTGSPDVDASRLDAAYVWPEEAEWTAGERWFACLAKETDPGDNPVRRTGSLRDVLADGLGDLRLCLVGSPADAGPPQMVPCEQPHRSEAVTPVLVLGKVEDPAPTQEQVAAMANPLCEVAVAKYLDGSRADIGHGWSHGSPEQWKSGFVTATCFAIAPSPVAGSLAYG